MLKANAIVGPNTKVTGLALDQIRERGGTWGAYQNEDLGHPEAGRLIFMQYGPNRAYKEPPAEAPDWPDWGSGWRYRFVGFVDATTGNILPEEVS